MTDETQAGGGNGGDRDPWAPPGHRPSLDKQQQPGAQDQPPARQHPAQPPTVHDQATMTSMPSGGFGSPGFGPPGTPTAGGGPHAAPPPHPAVPPVPGAPGGYGYPGYPAGYGWPGMPAAPQNGMGIAAMVLGIISCCLFCLYGVVSLITGILAVVFGIKGRKRVERGEATNHGQAQAGLIMGIIGIVLGAAVIVLMAIGITAAINQGVSDSGSSYGAASVSAPAHG
ncbi:DUF4190 domain-containing protein [Streptomyces sp. TRM68367]|uniref:DUF4190 domain-containing protein n=1 Tax=Streptomyces sp. TRM68367 TaxID=2758415 RepID=UPI0029343606|nr:DUF4190 domain-containing protein [Streptomyces sp. TRM68367]